MRVIGRMAEPLSFRLSELAELVGGEVQGNPDRTIEGVRTLANAGPQELSFVTSPRYRQEAAASKAGALLTSKALEGVEKDFLLADDPYYALAQILVVMYPPTRAEPGVHPTALVATGAILDPSATVGPYSVVGEGSQIGPGVEVQAHVVVGRECRVGRDSVLFPRVVVYDGCRIGERCILHAGVVVGSDGFGYALHEGQHVKLQHAGRVVVEDDVEIGANTTIDRALLDETRIGSGSKIDNLVQVAHNVRLGRGCVLVSQAGIAGSTRLGDGVVLAGQSGVAGHLELGDGVQVAAKSAVFKSVEASKKVAGIPALEASAWRRQQALAARLGELKKRIERLESQLALLEKEGNGG